MAIQIAEILACRRLGRSMWTYTLAIPKGMVWAGGAHMKLGLLEGLTAIKGEVYKNRELAMTSVALNELTTASFDPAYTKLVSISTRPKDGVVIFSMRIPDNPSVFKAHLASYEVGDTLCILEVNNFLEVPLKEPVVLLIQGVALSGMHALMRDLLEAGNQGPIICVNVVNPMEELRDLMIDDERVQYIFKSNRYSFGQTVRGLLMDRNIVRDFNFVVVGSHGFMKQWIHTLRIAGVRDEKIFIDRLAIQRSIYFPTLNRDNP